MREPNAVAEVDAQIYAQVLTRAQLTAAATSAVDAKHGSCHALSSMVDGNDIMPRSFGHGFAYPTHFAVTIHRYFLRLRVQVA